MDYRAMFTDKKQQYMYELRIDDKIIDKIKTDDFEVWYDKIPEKVYEINTFRKIGIIIKITQYGHFKNGLIPEPSALGIESFF